MKTYAHKQRATLILVAMLIASAITLLAGLLASPAALAVAPVLLICAWLFHSLTIEVTGHELRWRFGPGLIRRRVALGDIASAQPVRTNFIEGWGIHYSRFGWLYNVSGFDAVAITMKNGKRFALGTDEPQKLTEALRAAQPALM